MQPLARTPGNDASALYSSDLLFSAFPVSTVAPNVTACSVVELNRRAFACASVSPTAEMLREATPPADRCDLTLWVAMA